MENKSILLLGGGGHCRSVLDCLLRMGGCDRIGIVDREPSNAKIMGVPVVGTDDDLPRLLSEGWGEAFVTLGSIKTAAARERLAARAEQLGFRFPAIIDPSAAVSAYAAVGRGAFVGKNAVVNAGARVGAHCIINTGAIVEHDCVVEEYTHIAVGAILCGAVHVGHAAFVGAGSTVIQGVEIGEKSVIGAGSVVISNIADNRTAYGNPCRVAER